MMFPLCILHTTLPQVLPLGLLLSAAYWPQWFPGRWFGKHPWRRKFSRHDGQRNEASGWPAEATGGRTDYRTAPVHPVESGGV